MMRLDQFNGVVCCSDISSIDEFKPDIIYLETEMADRIWLAQFQCPCGCGEQARITTKGEPGRIWQLAVNDDGTFTASPSILRGGRCKSHFFIERNKVRWE